MPCKQREQLSGSNSVQKKTLTLKCTEYGSGLLSQNTKNQQIVNNGIIQNELNRTIIDSYNFGHPDPGKELIALAGEECKGMMEENMVGNKLKGYDDSSGGSEWIERNSSNLCKEDAGDFDKSHYVNYSRASSNNMTEASHLLGCEILDGRKEEVSGIYRMENRKEENLTVSNKMAEFDLACTNSPSSSSSLGKSDDNEHFKLERSQEQVKGMLEVCSSDRINSDNAVTIDTICSCDTVIRRATDDTQKSSDHKSLDIRISSSEVGGPRFRLTETAQDSKDEEGKLVSVQSTSQITDRKRVHCDRNQGLNTGKTFIVDDKNVGTGQVGSIIMLREKYGIVNGRGTEMSAAAIENRGTTNDVVHDGTLKLNTSGTDVSNNDEVACSNVDKKLETVENRPVGGTHKIIETATKRTGFFELFRSAVLRKYNLIMVFVW